MQSLCPPSSPEYFLAELNLFMMTIKWSLPLQKIRSTYQYDLYNAVICQRRITSGKNSLQRFFCGCIINKCNMLEYQKKVNRDVKSLISIVNTIIRLDTKQQKQTQKTAHFSSDILELKKLKTDTAHFALFNKTACSQRREMKPKLNASRKITILSILNSSTQFIYNTYTSSHSSKNEDETKKINYFTNSYFSLRNGEASYFDSNTKIPKSNIWAWLQESTSCLSSPSHLTVLVAL